MIEPANESLLGAGLPGVELIRQGIDDLAAGRETEASLLVEVGAPRLRRLGFVLPDAAGSGADAAFPEHRLYLRLVRSGRPDPYSAYNALIRRLVSFEQALEGLRPPEA